MPNTLLLKRSAVSAKIPAAGDLQYGELSINYADGVLYYKNNQNKVLPANATIANGVISGVAFLSSANTLITNSALKFDSSNGNLTLTSGSVSSSTTTGALVVTGGVGVSGAIYSGDAVKGLELFSTQSIGDEGGQLNLALAQTNTTLSGGIVIDVYQNRLRFFEQGGSTRGAYIDLSAAASGVGTNLLAAGTPGGANTQFQFNNAGAFDGASGLIYNNATGNVLVTTATSSSSANTGALVVAGGVGINGAVNLGSTLTAAGNTVINNTLYAQGIYDNSTRVVSTSNGAGNLTITGSSISMSLTGAAGTFGSATTVPVFTTDAYGRVISTTNTAITFPEFTQTANISLFTNTSEFNSGIFYPTFSNVVSGNTRISAASSLTYNTSTGNLTAQGFVGKFYGDIAASSANIYSTAASTSTTSGAFVVEGGVGIAGNINIGGTTNYISGSLGIGTSSPVYQLEVNGSFAATTKSFVIEHPTKPGQKLCYGSLESPYHGIRLTGEAEIIHKTCRVELPEYISELCKREGSQVQITNIKHGKTLWIEELEIDKNYFTVAFSRSKSDTKSYKFYWSLTAVRKDIPDLVVEQ